MLCDQHISIMIVTVKNGLTSLLLGLALTACGQSTPKEQETAATKAMDENTDNMDNLEVATFGAGCFWCVEAIFQEVQGVKKVESGYMGGTIKNPSYKEVCTGRTGHAEVVQITFDPVEVGFEELLEIFWQTHDPTTLNRQGADVGTQYRSAVFYHNNAQREKAEFYKQKLDESGAFSNPIVTEISPASAFYVAEDYHQNYFNENGDQPYCAMVIRPKMEKFKKAFKEKLKH